MKVRVKTLEELKKIGDVMDSGNLIECKGSGILFNVSNMGEYCDKEIELNSSKRYEGWVFEPWMYDVVENPILLEKGNGVFCELTFTGNSSDGKKIFAEKPKERKKIALYLSYFDFGAVRLCDENGMFYNSDSQELSITHAEQLKKNRSKEVFCYIDAETYERVEE